MRAATNLLCRKPSGWDSAPRGVTVDGCTGSKWSTRPLIRYLQGQQHELITGCGRVLGPDRLHTYVRATRAGDAMVSEAGSAKPSGRATVPPPPRFEDFTGGESAGAGSPRFVTGGSWAAEIGEPQETRQVDGLFRRSDGPSSVVS
jgi:hypothetical protein